MTLQYWKRYLWAIGLIALFFTGKLIYVMFYTLLLVYLSTRWITRKGFNNLVVRRIVPTTHIFRGESFTVKLEVSNPIWTPLVWVSATDELPTGMPTITARQAIFALAPKQTVSFSYESQGKRRGVHQIGPIYLEAGDPWGLETLRGRVDSFADVIVYPQVHALSDLRLPSSLPVGEVRTSQRFFEDPARTIGVREYKPGDPLKRMHWKVSARANHLHVREFQPTIALDTTLFLNLNSDEYEPSALGYMSEFAIEVAASLAYYLHQQRQPVGLVTNGRDGGPVIGEVNTKPIQISSRKGASQLMQIMEALARVQVHAGKPFTSCLTDEGRQLSWGSTLLIITPDDTDEIVETLLNLRSAGYRLVVFLVGNRVLHPEYLLTSPVSGLTFYRVRHSGELEALSHRAAG
ncbi:MAG: DUF58 domain-containing protein [Limnochordia bacterium]